MDNNLNNLIYDISLRIRLLKASHAQKKAGDLSDREILLMEILKARKEICVTDISKLYPSVSTSTISTTITDLWKKKLVVRETPPDNLRLTLVRLTAKGEKALEEIQQVRGRIFSTIITSLNLNKNEEKIFIDVLNRAIDFFDKELF